MNTGVAILIGFAVLSFNVLVGASMLADAIRYAGRAAGRD